jgi:hypothetical protein
MVNTHITVDAVGTYPPSTFWKSGGIWWNIKSTLYVPEEAEINAGKVRETRWPSD